MPGAMKTTDPFSMNGILFLEDVGAGDITTGHGNSVRPEIVLQAIDVLYSHVDERLRNALRSASGEYGLALRSSSTLRRWKSIELLKVGRRQRIEWRWASIGCRSTSSQFRHAPGHRAAGVDEAAPLAGKMRVLETRDRRVEGIARHARHPCDRGYGHGAFPRRRPRPAAPGLSSMMTVS